jgi:hypothetical protein
VLLPIRSGMTVWMHVSCSQAETLAHEGRGCATSEPEELPGFVERHATPAKYF